MNCSDLSGVIFVGPPSTAIRDMGIKSTSKVNINIFRKTYLKLITSRNLIKNKS